MATPTKPTQPRHTVTAHGVAVGDLVWEFPKLHEVTAVETRTRAGLRGNVTMVHLTMGRLGVDLDPQTVVEVW